jgi:type II secretory pathway pseudopilin PulG
MSLNFSPAFCGNKLLGGMSLNGQAIPFGGAINKGTAGLPVGCSMNKKALSLLEILVSITLLSITMTGMLNIFTSSTRQSRYSRSRLTAAELARSFVDALHMDVRQDQWGTNCLSGFAGSCPSSALIITPGDIPYTPIVTCEGAPGTGIVRRVTAKVTWNEP